MLAVLIIFGLLYLVYRTIRKSGRLWEVIVLPPSVTIITGAALFLLAALNNSTLQSFHADPFFAVMAAVGYPLLFGYPIALTAFFLNRWEKRKGKKHFEGPSDPSQRYLWANRLPPYEQD